MRQKTINTKFHTFIHAIGGRVAKNDSDIGGYKLHQTPSDWHIEHLKAKDDNSPQPFPFTWSCDEMMFDDIDFCMKALRILEKGEEIPRRPLKYPNDLDNYYRDALHRQFLEFIEMLGGHVCVQHNYRDAGCYVLEYLDGYWIYKIVNDNGGRRYPFYCVKRWSVEDLTNKMFFSCKAIKNLQNHR